MELGLLLAEQIAIMFIAAAIGFILVRTKVLKVDDSRVLSQVVVYVCGPCVIINSFQITVSKERLGGLALAVGVSLIMHAYMIIMTKLLEKPMRLNPVEKATMIYTNSGNLIIPLVTAVFGTEWVFYSMAFNTLQTILVWTHMVSLFGEKGNLTKKIMKNPNMIAICIGFIMFIAGIKIPSLPEQCISGLGNMIGYLAMLVVGMLIGNADLKAAFMNRKAYVICLFRLIIYPGIGAVILLALGKLNLHPDAEYIMLIVLLAAAAPAAVMVTQVSQIYKQDSEEASILNVMSVLFCIITMPIVVILFEMFWK